MDLSEAKDFAKSIIRDKQMIVYFSFLIFFAYRVEVAFKLRELLVQRGIVDEVVCRNPGRYKLEYDLVLDFGSETERLNIPREKCGVLKSWADDRRVIDVVYSSAGTFDVVLQVFHEGSALYSQETVDLAERRSRIKWQFYIFPFFPIFFRILDITGKQRAKSARAGSELG